MEQPAADEPPVVDLGGEGGGGEEEEEEEEEEELEDEGAGAGAAAAGLEVELPKSLFLAVGEEALEVESMASKASAPFDLLAP